MCWPKIRNMAPELVVPCECPLAHMRTPSTIRGSMLPSVREPPPGRKFRLEMQPEILARRLLKLPAARPLAVNRVPMEDDGADINLKMDTAARGI